MAVPTYTRQQIRRFICQAERMEFFLRYAAGYVPLTGTPTQSILYATTLTQVDGYWNNAFAFLTTGTYAGQERAITTFLNSGASLTLEYALGGSPSAGDNLELLEIWPASQIHNYINQTIESYGRNFLDTVIDETTILCENKLTYDVSSLSRLMRDLAQIWLEHNTTRVTMLATAGATGSVTLGNNTFADSAFNGWKISIYGGTGAGQLRTVGTTTASTKVLTVTQNWTTTPDTTSKICIWNPSNQQTTWERLNSVVADRPEWPDNLYFQDLYSNSYGMRVRLVYSSEPPVLTAEADTSTVHMPLLVNAVRGLLHESLTSDSRADSNRHTALANFFSQKAEKIAQEDSPRRPTSTVWVTETGTTFPEFNPLNWGR